MAHETFTFNNPRIAQIQQMHAPFIHAMVKACTNEAEKIAFLPQINTLKQHGWAELSGVCQKILDGDRSERLLSQLDEEDSAIVSAILSGIQNPSTLPDINAKPDGTAAAPGLASIIHAASKGDAQALHTLSTMAEQMRLAGGDMAQIASVLRPLSLGERDIDKLSEKLTSNARSLLIAITAELAKLDTH